MARRSDHSREEIRTMALTAARRIVETDGLREMTARHVANAIGYSPGTLYNLFEGLDDLVLHLNGETLDSLRSHLDAVRPSGVPEADLKGLAAAYIAFIDDHPNLWAAVMDHSLPGGREVPDWYQDKVDGLMLVVEAALTPLFGGDEAVARRETARILWSSLHGICSLSRSGKLSVVTAVSVPQMVNDLIVTLLAGVRVRRVPG